MFIKWVKLESKGKELFSDFAKNNTNWGGGAVKKQLKVNNPEIFSVLTARAMVSSQFILRVNDKLVYTSPRLK